jgi:acylphosphatase
MATERRRLIYSGRVQGVGFRFTAQRLAARFPMTGYVRNLPDGRVELVAEGEPESVSAFLAAIQSEMGRRIQDVSESVETAGDPPYSDFFIRYD